MYSALFVRSVAERSPIPLTSRGKALGVGAAIRMVSTAACDDCEMTEMVTTVFFISGGRYLRAWASVGEEAWMAA